MKKMYSEKQYREYCRFMDKIANSDLENIEYYFQFHEWLSTQRISEMAQQQMEERLEEECIRELQGQKEECKVIQFPKR